MQRPQIHHPPRVNENSFCFSSRVEPSPEICSPVTYIPHFLSNTRAAFNQYIREGEKRRKWRLVMQCIWFIRLSGESLSRPAMCERCITSSGSSIWNPIPLIHTNPLAEKSNRITRFHLPEEWHKTETHPSHPSLQSEIRAGIDRSSRVPQLWGQSIHPHEYRTE